MSEVRGLRVSASVVLKAQRLLALLKGRDPADSHLMGAIGDAQLLGSLELSGFGATWDEVVASHEGSGPEPIRRLRQARAAVDPKAAPTLDALRAWHAPLFGAEAGCLHQPPPHTGGAPPPPPLIPSPPSLPPD